MTLDDESWEDMARRQEEADREQRHAEMAARDLCESVDAEEAMWSGIFRRMAYERPTVRYVEDKPGIDRRMFGPQAS